MELDGTQPVELKVAKITFLKNSTAMFFFPEVMTRLLKVIHRPCCEQFHVGTIVFLHDWLLQNLVTHS